MKKIGYVVVLASLFASCQKEEIISTPSTPNIPKISNNSLREKRGLKITSDLSVVNIYDTMVSKNVVPYYRTFDDTNTLVFEGKINGEFKIYYFRSYSSTSQWVDLSVLSCIS